MRKRTTQDHYYVMVRIKKWQDWAVYDSYDKALAHRETLMSQGYVTHIKKKRGTFV